MLLRGEKLSAYLWGGGRSLHTPSGSFWGLNIFFPQLLTVAHPGRKTVRGKCHEFRFHYSYTRLLLGFRAGRFTGMTSGPLETSPSRNQPNAPAILNQAHGSSHFLFHTFHTANQPKSLNTPRDLTILNLSSALVKYGALPYTGPPHDPDRNPAPPGGEGSASRSFYWLSAQYQ